VGNGDNVDGVLFDPVNDSVGKVLHDKPAIRIVEQAGSVRELLDALNRSVKHCGKRVAQAIDLGFIVLFCLLSSS